MNHYPAHDFVISPSEAKQAGLPIREATSYDEWRLVQKLHRGFRASSVHSLIEIWDQHDLIHAASQFDEPDEKKNNCEQKHSSSDIENDGEVTDRAEMLPDAGSA